MKMQWSLFLIILMGQCSSSTCQPHVYHFIKEAKTWDEAQSYCRETYTDLATIDNMEDMKRLIDSAGGGNSDAAWIGLKKTGDREWHWSLPGTEYNKNETRWASDEPNGGIGRPTENCVWMKTDGKWFDISCDEKTWFICYDDKVILIREEKTWDEALDYCREKHDDLVSIHDPDIQDLVQERAKTADTPYVWLGMRYTSTLDFWFWVSDGAGCYENWAPGNGTGECGTAAAMEKGGGQWVSLPDDKKYNFICTK
ncbi:macrophage mannose receptor 1-like isoform X3 [Centroberyx affinis]|uniref:macrophage mannose receptor 1-like isoform X3 n=1 Tax=Centroberyx affinis TaxID=166261 RepID=UPI003A5BDC0F